MANALQSVDAESLSDTIERRKNSVCSKRLRVYPSERGMHEKFLNWDFDGEDTEGCHRRLAVLKLEAWQYIQ